MPNAVDVARPRVPESAGQVARRQQTREHYRRVVLAAPPADQHAWLESADVVKAMGATWCARRLDALAAVRRRLESLVPSGAWLEAVWHGSAVFPPQEPYCPLAVAARLYGAAAAGRVTTRRLAELLGLLASGADPLQLVARYSSRMRMSRCHSAFGTGLYDADGRPLLQPPTRRFTPPQSAELEDRYDRMTAVGALFCADLPSVSAVQIQRIELLRGRNVDDKRRARRRRRQLAVKGRIATAV